MLSDLTTPVFLVWTVNFLCKLICNFIEWGLFLLFFKHALAHEDKTYMNARQEDHFQLKSSWSTVVLDIFGALHIATSTSFSKKCLHWLLSAMTFKVWLCAFKVKLRNSLYQISGFDFITFEISLIVDTKKICFLFHFQLITL